MIGSCVCVRETGERIQNGWRERAREKYGAKVESATDERRDTKQRDGATNKRGGYGANDFE